MKIYFFIFLIFKISFSYGQINDVEIEYDLIRKNCCAKFETNKKIGNHYESKDSFLLNEILNDSLNKNFKKYISNRFLLRRIKNIFCNDDSLVAIDGSKENFFFRANLIEKNIGEIKNISTDTFEGFKFITNENNKIAYGLFYYSEKVKIFDKIEVFIKKKKIVIPKEAFNDLFFPNFCSNYIPSIKPLEIYISKDGLNYYVYIFGLQRSDLGNIVRIKSFMCKLIFNEHKYIGRIISELRNYDWKFCDNFIGF